MHIDRCFIAGLTTSYVFSTMIIKRTILFFLFTIILHPSLRGACPTLNKGSFIKNAAGCASLDVVFQVKYGNLDPTETNMRIVIDWGDGSPTIELELSDSDDLTDPKYFEKELIHTYPANMGICEYEIETYIINSSCFTAQESHQSQTVIVWDTDELMEISPSLFQVCQGTAASLRFTDAGDWNCFTPAQTGRPNDEFRTLQWIYGLNIANSIEGVTVDDGVGMVSTFPLTDLPYDTDVHGSQSFEVFVPATKPNGNPHNIGDRYIVELRNWNQCNPYDDTTTAFVPNRMIPDPGEWAPVVKTAIIEIVDAPDPSFRVRNSAGVETNNFCIDDQLFLQPNQAGLTYTWEFFDASNNLLHTHTGSNPNYAFSSGGQKRIKLTVAPSGIVGSCLASSEKIINIFPVAQAKIGVADINGNTIQPEFCQDGSNSYTHTVRFTDETLGWDANTEGEWIFYDHTGSEIKREVASGPPSYFEQDYIDPGIYKVKLTIWDKTVPGCTSEDEVSLVVYRIPQPDFTYLASCANPKVTFTDQSILSTINGDAINLWEWDFSYDGIHFNMDRSSASPDPFDYDLSGVGDHQVALRVTTAKGSCSQMITKTVKIKPNPIPSFTTAPVEGCSPLTTELTNTSLGSQPSGVTISGFEWLIDQGSGFVSDITLDPADPAYTDIYQKIFINNTNQTKTFQVKLRATSTDGCVVESAPQSVKIFPQIGLDIINDYNVLGDNCSPVPVNFTGSVLDPMVVPEKYSWKVEELNNVLSQAVNPGTDPNFSYTFNNISGSAKSYKVTLEVEKTGYCFAPKFVNVFINPIPSSAFDIIKTEEGCNHISYHIEAQQKNLKYEWEVNGATYATDQFNISFNRPESNQADLKYDVKLKTIDTHTNCESVVSVKELVVPRKESMNVVLDLAGAKEGCAPFTASFSNTSTNFPTGTSFDLQISKDGKPWQVSEPITGNTTDQFQVAFDSSGVYQIVLSAVSPSGCNFVSTPSQVVTVYPEVVSAFETDKLMGCSPLEISFANWSDGNDNPGSAWYYQEVGTEEMIHFSNDAFPSHTFVNESNAEKVYEVFYVAESMKGCMDTSSKKIKVAPGVTPSFSIHPGDQGCTPLPVTLNNNKLREGVTYIWYYGDGEPNDTTHMEPELDHTFLNNSVSSLKTYNITLTAIDNVSGCENKLSKPVRVYPMINVNVSPDQLDGCAPLTVNFENNTIGAEEHQWYYRLSGSSERYEITVAKDVNYVLNNKGTGDLQYEVVYEARNKYGCIEQHVSSHTVYPELKASFTVNPQKQVLPNSSVSIYNATNKGDWDYSWDYGDGKGYCIETDPAKYTYETYGAYEIKLVVSHGPCVSEHVRTVVIEPVLPEVDFDCDPKKGCRPLTVHFENLSTYADSETYFWDFGDNQGFSTAKDPTYTFNEAGTYTVTLEASNKLGTKVKKEKKYLIEVYDIPYAKFRVNPAPPKQVYTPDPVYFTNYSFGADLYNWQFGDGQTSDEYEPQHVYEQAGFYDIILQVSSEQGCSNADTLQSAVEVIEGGTISLPNVFTPSLDGPSGGNSQYNNSNDVFIPKIEGVVEFNMQIFNRWGELIFESKSKDIGWDGYYKGVLCAQDVYIYKLQLKYADGERSVKVGDVTLLR